MRRFLAARRRSGRHEPLARRAAFLSLRTFYRWLEATGRVANRAMAQITMPRIPHSVPKPLTIDKAKALVEGESEGDD